jgi:hypothetical protein
MTPAVLSNMIMGKLYNVLTNGDETVPKSDDNFFTWMTPGMPVDPADFDFLTQGLTGVVRKQDLDTLRGPQAKTNGGGEKPAEGGEKPAEAGEKPAEGEKPTGGIELTASELDKLRAQDTSRLYMQAESLARLSDFVPDVSKINNEQFARFNVANNEGSLSEIWERVLRMSQVMETPLDDATLKKIEKFRGLLQVTKQKKNLLDDSITEVKEAAPLVIAYNEKMAAYEAAALEYNTRRIDALTASTPRAVHDWAINANILRNKVKAAMADWINNGYKNDYEQIAAYLDQVQGRDLTLLKQQYKDDLAKAKLTGISSGSDFYYTSLVPASFVKGGWTTFRFASGDTRASQNSSYSTSKWGAKANAGFMGIFGASASHQQSKSRQEFHGKMDSEKFSLQFDICQAQIVRPWLHVSFMKSKAWRFDQNNPDVKSEMINDGAMPPKGLLPAYPTSMVFVRNLKLRMGKSKAFQDFMDEQKSKSTEAGGSASFGPFSLGGGGSYSSASGNKKKSSGYSYSSEGMDVPGMQVIGFKCNVMPKSPQPNPQIKEWV